MTRERAGAKASWQQGQRAVEAGSQGTLVLVTTVQAYQTQGSSVFSLCLLCMFWNREAGFCYLDDVLVKNSERRTLLAADPL